LAAALAFARRATAPAAARASLYRAAALAGALTLAADLSAFALHLGGARLHAGVAFPCAFGHGAHGRFTLRGDHLDLKLTLRLGAERTDGLGRRVARRLRLLAWAFFLRVDVGGA